MRNKERNISTIFSNVENIEELDQKIEAMMQKQGPRTWYCSTCGKTIDGGRMNAREHGESHIDGLSFSCNFCDKTFRSRSSLRVHTGKYHGKKDQKPIDLKMFIFAGGEKLRGCMRPRIIKTKQAVK